MWILNSEEGRLVVRKNVSKVTLKGVGTSSVPAEQLRAHTCEAGEVCGGSGGSEEARLLH